MLGLSASALLTAGAALAPGMATASAAEQAPETTTPIKHVVVLFSENISFDHYFATYPKAANTDGEKLQGGDINAPKFQAKPDTPKDIDTLESAGLIDQNPNAIKPFRLTPGQAVTCSQNHEYDAEQKAFNGGKMDKFNETAAKDNCASKGKNIFDKPGENMGYYDGNTTQGIWNYAQNFSMSDNHFGTQFGPSTPGALNLVAGNVTPTLMHDPKSGAQVPDMDNEEIAGHRKDEFGRDVSSIVADPDPAFDDCSNRSSATSDTTASVDAPNVGDKMNEKGVSWGWFQGGFRPSEPATDTQRARCGHAHPNVGTSKQVDYNPHHQPFQYFASTANPHHLAPANEDEIGHDGQANHQYDIEDFDTVVKKGNLPAVSFLKAGNYEDGHPGNSDPVDEQRFLAREINQIENSPAWKDTAIMIAYDDSDGWYDHKATDILNGSNDDKVDSSICKDAVQKVGAVDNVAGRCGPGTRHPFILVSPFAKANHVDHTLTEQTSILRFIEDNWQLGRLGKGAFDERAGKLDNMFDFHQEHAKPLFLNQDDGTVASSFESARVQNVDKVKADLKPVAEGQNDPKGTEPKAEDSKFVQVKNLSSANQQGQNGQKKDGESASQAEQGSKSGGLPVWAWALIGAAVAALLVALLAASRRKKAEA